MKSATPIAITVGLIFFCCTASYGVEPKKNRATKTAPGAAQPVSAQKRLQATRQMLIERMKASRERLNEVLSLYEAKLAKQTEAYEAKKKQYEQDLISKLELEDSLRAVTNTRLDTERVRQWITEDDLALSLAEETAMEQLADYPVCPGEVMPKRRL